MERSTSLRDALIIVMQIVRISTMHCMLASYPTETSKLESVSLIANRVHKSHF